MRHALIGLLLVAATVATTPAHSAVNVSIGINVPAYPSLVRVPNYPVYYAPSLPANYFFYDGLYWVFVNGTWYESPWYNGPWYAVDPFDVPVFLLRVPVRYYHARPAFFESGWAHDAPPHWGTYWGASWSQRHSGWDRWDRHSAPAPAPLPLYQKSYSGSSYPSVQQQAVIQTKSYSYQPRESITKTRFQERRTVAQQRDVASAKRDAKRDVVPAKRDVVPAKRDVVPAKAGTQPKRDREASPPPRQAEPRTQQARAPQQDRALQARAQQNQQRAQARAEQKQRPERVQQAERKEKPQRQDKGKGKDRDDNG